MTEQSPKAPETAPKLNDSDWIRLLSSIEPHINRLIINDPVSLWEVIGGREEIIKAVFSGENFLGFDLELVNYMTEDEVMHTVIGEKELAQPFMYLFPTTKK